MDAAKEHNADTVPLPTTLWVYVHDGFYEGLPEHGRAASEEAEALWGRCMDDLRHRGLVVVEAKQQPKGPRAQVITPSDTVRTKEGQLLAIALHQAEERELDLLAEIGRLKRLIDGTEP